MVNKIKKGIIFAKKSIAGIYQPICKEAVWPEVFNSLRRIPESGLYLNVMSFNIRRGTARDGKNHWIFRRNRISELLNHFRPDVLGLQEALDFQISEIGTMLPGYKRIGSGSLGGSKGLFNAVFYDAERFFPSEEGTFWFSDKPDIPGSKGWGNILPRTCTWARLIEKESKQAFYFYNVHLDHISRRSRKNSVILVTRFIHMRSSPDPFVLTGDFNAREKSTPIQYLKGKIPLRIRAKGSVLNPEPLMDTFRVRYPSIRNVTTFHGFRSYLFRFKFDYIFVPSYVRVIDAIIIQPQWKKCYPSDHFPLLANIALSAVSATENAGAFY
ncbi:MAG: endonuclease/exonuclease/phosphatase family protein [Desulfobacteraceae bacterium]|nr:MAG: endonuclease/exonuclease/phosphatase family protein [Desulfobacteraceae bacterium]